MKFSEAEKMTNSFELCHRIIYKVNKNNINKYFLVKMLISRNIKYILQAFRREEELTYKGQDNYFDMRVLITALDTRRR